ncbi:MAG: AAA family ATPase [Coriobacteriales bacterium]|jgi:AAA+ ATPase superfamily predicted ATPase|nr:AAA family ATPase [Coriobacteriales bacterium]
MSPTIIAREHEREILKSCLKSEQSEFVAVYGRRRVGKTFLVKEFFHGAFTFYATGVLGGTKEVQIANFNEEIANHGGGAFSPAANWHEAFENLNNLIAQSPRKEKKVIFLDELPWMDTEKSGLLQALDHFWNRWASTRHDVLLIVCGSATSWMLHNLIDNYGGLYNRLTREIALAPFTLAECEAYYQHRNVAYTRHQMVEAYMIFGGIPQYLRLMDARFSLYQNVDALYFTPNAPLRNEYHTLLRSLFKKAQSHQLIVEALASKGTGLTREELLEKTGLSDGGSFKRSLDDLINNGFIRSYRAFGKKERGRLYQMVDPFMLFHLRFNEKRETYNENYWLQFSPTSAHGAWSGYAFEQVCLLHIPQIRRGLGVSGVLTEVSSWRSKESDPGAQVDLVIDRRDNVVNLCEMKYVANEFVIDKAYDAVLRDKRTAFVTETKTRKVVQTTLITTFGTKHNQYSNAIPSQLTLDALFT